MCCSSRALDDTPLDDLVGRPRSPRSLSSGRAADGASISFERLSHASRESPDSPHAWISISTFSYRLWHSDPIERRHIASQTMPDCYGSSSSSTPGEPCVLLHTHSPRRLISEAPSLNQVHFLRKIFDAFPFSEPTARYARARVLLRRDDRRL